MPSTARQTFLIFTTFLLVASPSLADPSPAPLADARKLYLTGKYAEALEAYEAGAKEHPIAAAVGQARCLVANGKLEEAEAALTAALIHDSKSATLHAEFAQLFFDRGDYEVAEQHAVVALAVDAKSRLARWIKAELL